MIEHKLYGLDKGGKFKVWVVSTNGNELTIVHGKEGGKMQTKVEIVPEGKQGRTPAEQAVFEAESRYKKQVDKGYRPSKEELTDLPLLPMLAQDYTKQGHRIKFPCITMPKLDGVRCLAIRHDDHVELKSRGGKAYHVPHIEEALLNAMRVGEVWDGEIYLHGKYLEEIVSAVKREDALQKEIKARLKFENAVGDALIEEAYGEYMAAVAIRELREKLEFHVFDVVTDDTYEVRVNMLYESLNTTLKGSPVIKVVGFYVVSDEQQMKKLHRIFVNMGYEGIMLRNMGGMYESGKRSADLQKYKEFFEEEFRITYVREDRNGNAMLGVYDHIANGEFETSCGDFVERARQLAEPETVIGCALTTKFQTRYKDSRLPQFPTGVRIRAGVWLGNVFTPTE